MPRRIRDPRFDRGLVEAAQGLRDEPLDTVFEQLSTLPVRHATLAALTVAASARRRSALPLVAVVVAVSFNTVVTRLLKRAVDRARPPQAEVAIESLGALPGDALVGAVLGCVSGMLGLAVARVFSAGETLRRPG